MISALIKGFFSSIWDTLFKWSQKRERIHAARLESERKEVEEIHKVLTKKRKVDVKKYTDLDDVLDDL